MYTVLMVILILMLHLRLKKEQKVLYMYHIPTAMQYTFLKYVILYNMYS